MRLVIIILLALFPFLVQAQSNFKKGYVVTFAGDTLKGFIDFREWNRSPEAFTFKANLENEAAQKFTPDDCRSFEITGLENYHRYQVRISLDEVNFPKLSTGLDTTSKVSAVFLKELQKGENVTLFSYKDVIKNRLYLLHHDQNQPEELIYHIYYKPKALNVTQQFTIESKHYVGQLWLAATKYNKAVPELKRQLDLAHYSEPDILRVVSKINGIDKSNFKKNNSEYPRTRFFAGAGITRTASTFSGKDHVLTYVTEWDEQNAINVVKPSQNKEDLTYKPKVNVGLDFFPFPKTQQLMLRGEVSVGLTEFVFANVHDQRVQKRQIFFEYTGQQLLTTISAQVLYNLYNADKVKLYVGAGYSYIISNYLENSLYFRINTNGQSTEESTSDNYMPLDKFWANFPIRAGITLNKNIDLSVNYWPPVRLLPGPIQTEVNYLDVEINYLFNKKRPKS